jgi:UDP-N-acetylglucosamine 2-epimerase (non-hydrolysing)
MPKIEDSTVLSRLGLNERRYFLVSAHREENVDSPDNLKAIFQILNNLVEKYNEPVVVTTHPRTRKRIDVLGLTAHPLVRFMRPFGFIDYMKLQINAHCVISDSGTVTEESSILNFPALNLREVHERPEGFEEGSVMFVGLNSERIFQGLGILENQPRGHERAIKIVGDYTPNNVSLKVLRIIQSYTDFINRKVWRKSNLD